MKKAAWTVFLFPASSHAIRAEKLFKEMNLAAKLVPVPRQLSSDCGLCVRVPRTQREKAKTIAAESRLPSADIHDIP